MKKYEEPTLEVQMFSIEDVIADTSPEPGNISDNPLDLPEIDTDQA